MHVTFLFGLIVPTSYDEYTAQINTERIAGGNLDTVTYYSVVINSLSGFSVPFSVISVLRSAQCNEFAFSRSR